MYSLLAASLLAIAILAKLKRVCRNRAKARYLFGRKGGSSFS